MEDVIHNNNKNCKIPRNKPNKKSVNPTFKKKKKTFKTLLKDIKEHLKKWRGIPCSWMGRFNSVKMSILPKLICKFNALPIKIPKGFLMELDMLILKFIWKRKYTEIAKNFLKKQLEGCPTRCQI